MDKPWPTMNPIQFQEFNPTRTGDKQLDLNNIRSKAGVSDSSKASSASGTKRNMGLDPWNAEQWLDTGMN